MMKIIFFYDHNFRIFNTEFIVNLKPQHMLKIARMIQNKLYIQTVKIEISRMNFEESKSSFLPVIININPDMIVFFTNDILKIITLFEGENYDDLFFATKIVIIFTEKQTNYNNDNVILRFKKESMELIYKRKLEIEEESFSYLPTEKSRFSI